MPTRRLAAIMFTDIVGYTAMMQQNEQEGLAKVRRFSQTMEEQVKSHHGEILQFMGDGCLCIFNSAVEAMHAAKNIQESLQAEPKVPLRIGIHIGDIVIQEGNIYGDGVNLASRVESMGVPGSILVTERVIHDVKSHPEFDMTSLGKFQFKNVEKPMEVFALANEGFAIPKAIEMEGKGKKYRPIYKQLIFAVLGILLLIGGVLGFQQYQQASALKKLEKSLVVLPFTNKSEEANTDYFSDGITEDILIQLSKIKSLKVISQTSAMRYKDSDQPLNEIADELNVNFVLRGTVRKIGNQVRISAQLVQAEEDVNLWAENYDFELENVFEVQAEVSRSIAKQLEAQISPEEQKQLDQKPTENQQAYQLYLRGRLLIKDRSKEGIESAEKLFEEALTLDPNFLHAKAELANILFIKGDYTYLFEVNQAETYAKAYHLSKEIISARPDISRAHDVIATVIIKFPVLTKFHEALTHYREALRYNPKDSEILHHTASLLSRLGKHEEAKITILKALEYDPFSPIVHAMYIRILIYGRELHTSEKYYDISTKLFPNNKRIVQEKAYIDGFRGACDQIERDLSQKKHIGNNRIYFNLIACYCTKENAKKAKKYLAFLEKEGWVASLAFARLDRNKDEMFAILTEALPQTINAFHVLPFFDILRDDPRYEEYLRQSPFGQVSDADVEAVMELVR